MTNKIITEGEARELLELRRAVPWRKLNEAGMTAVADWLMAMAREPANVNIDAWYQQVDRDAGNVGIDSAVIAEMRGYMTITGRPETLRLSPEHFVWMVCGEMVTS